MKAIIYKSNAGHTKEYAAMLGAKTGLPVYDADKAAASLKKSDEVIFLGWIRAGALAGYEKAKKRYDIKAVCAVGMSVPDQKTADELRKKHRIEGIGLFYLQGGFDISRLSGIYKFMMNQMIRMMEPALLKKEDKTEAEEEYLKMIKEGGDFVNEENLRPVIEWYERCQSL